MPVRLARNRRPIPADESDVDEFGKMNETDEVNGVVSEWAEVSIEESAPVCLYVFSRIVFVGWIIMFYEMVYTLSWYTQ